MSTATNFIMIIGCAIIVLFFCSSASAQLENQLSAYTGKNAPGYLGPLVDAFGADLNAGTFHTAHIPTAGLQLSLEFRFMSVLFSDNSRTFLATTEGDFMPVTITEAPTVVGSKKAVFVDGEGSTRFAFPGGFDLDSFSLIVPQLRIGSLYGTEALLRYFYFNMSDADFGMFHLYGFGLRHSISQYVYKFIPVDLAMSLFWQRFSLDDNERRDDLVTADALTVGLHVSKNFNNLQPYAGISFDRFAMDVSYNSSSTFEAINLSLESDDTIHVTLGLSLNVSFMVAHGEYNFGNQNAFSLGIAFQFRPI